jgi:hypothetical protein
MIKNNHYCQYNRSRLRSRDAVSGWPDVSFSL